MDKINVELLNKLNAGTKLMNSNLIRAIQRVPDSELAKGLIERQSETLAVIASPDSKSKIASTINRSPETVESLLTEDSFVANYNNYKEAVDEITRLSSDFLTTFVKSETFPSSVDVSGLQSYLGVDLGLIKFDTATSFFVTLYPYLKRTDPEGDYKLNAKNLLHLLTPALGFGIGGDIGNIKPVYFLGLGFRVSKVFRFAAGGTYFKTKEEPEESWNFGVSASINVNYIADLMRLITAAQSPVNK